MTPRRALPPEPLPRRAIPYEPRHLAEEVIVAEYRYGAAVGRWVR